MDCERRFRGLRLFYGLKKQVDKSKDHVMNTLKIHVAQQKTMILSSLVSALERKQVLNKASALCSIKLYSLLKTFQHSQRNSFKQPQKRKQTFDVSENVSEIMEENIRESEMDVQDKNAKISIIKSSQLLSHKINEHGSYLQTMRNGTPLSPESDIFKEYSMAAIGSGKHHKVHSMMYPQSYMNNFKDNSYGSREIRQS